MKKQYTEMVTSLRRAHKRTGMSYDDLYEIALPLIDEDGEGQRELRLRRAAVSMEMLYETRAEVRHVFMPGRDFCHWLSECARTLDPELGMRAVEGFGAPVVCLHFPCGEGMASALIGIGTCVGVGSVVIDFSSDSATLEGAVVHTKLAGQSAAEQMRANYIHDGHTPVSRRQIQADTAEFYTRMIAGLGLYMTCFPEQVKDGIPSDAKRADYARGNAKTIGVSDKVIQRDGPTPHYRSGHFRLLSADRYVNKRGQVVFVHGCFVKGQAKTVLSPESEVEA